VGPFKMLSSFAESAVRPAPPGFRRLSVFRKAPSPLLLFSSALEPPVGIADVVLHPGFFLFLLEMLILLIKKASGSSPLYFISPQ